MAAAPLAGEDQIDPADRFVVRETLARWNRCLDRGDVAGLRDLSTGRVSVSYEATRFEGAGALEDFVASTRAPGLSRRTHVNHLQAWPTSDGIRTRALALVVHLVGATAPSGDGSPFPAWAGYTEDELERDGEGWRVASRRFERWDGDVLAGFSRFAEGVR